MSVFAVVNIFIIIDCDYIVLDPVLGAYRLNMCEEVGGGGGEGSL